MATEENSQHETTINQKAVSPQPAPLDTEGNDTKQVTTGSEPQAENNASVADKDTKEEEDQSKTKAEGSVPRSLSHITTEKGDCSTTRETNCLLVDLRESEKAELLEFRSMVEEAILLKKIYRHKENSKTVNITTDEEQNVDTRHKDQDQDPKKELEEKKEKQQPEEGEEVSDQKSADYNKDKGKEIVPEEEGDKVVDDNNKKASENGEIYLWGVPLLPSRGDERTDVILVKFLRARDFKASDAFDMLRNTLQWRLENNIDSILQEDLGFDFLDSVAFIDGVDREGHLVCYNQYGIFANEELYNKTFGNTESREKFLRWRVQLMEKQIQKLDFSPGGVSSLLQINDLKETLGPTRKDIRMAIRKVVELLQDNYPEFVVRNIFINVPFWYYAVNTVWYPFLTQRTKSKIVFARSAKVTEILFKYISAEEIPTKYGGLKRENDPDFSTKDGVSEVVVNAGALQTIDIPAPEVNGKQHYHLARISFNTDWTRELFVYVTKIGRRIVWDLTIVGWDVTYKEEFVPTDEKSYALIVKRSKNLALQEEPIRNSFQPKEPGKLVLTVENGIFKKKRVYYRYKTKEAISII